MPEETIKIVNDLMKLANDTDTAYIDKYSDLQIMIHCAEEMGECACALNKLIRIILDGPKSRITEESAKANMVEELADAMSLGYMLARKLGCETDLAEIHYKKSVSFNTTLLQNE